MPLYALHGKNHLIMTRIDFYITEDSEPDAAMRLACRIAEKAYGQQLMTHIHTETAAQSETVDQLLWSFRDESFIPHEIDHPALERELADMPFPPVSIGVETPSRQQVEVIINLAHEVPLFFSRFNRLAEIIDGNSKIAGRERYKFYRDRGYELNTHRL